jgi:hypothetical protein
VQASGIFTVTTIITQHLLEFAPRHARVGHLDLVLRWLGKASHHIFDAQPGFVPDTPVFHAAVHEITFFSIMIEIGSETWRGARPNQADRTEEARDDDDDASTRDHETRIFTHDANGWRVLLLLCL